MSGSGLKSDACVSKQLNSWESGARSKVRNGQHAGVWSPAAAGMAELPGGAWNAI